MLRRQVALYAASFGSANVRNVDDNELKSRGYWEKGQTVALIDCLHRTFDSIKLVELLLNRVNDAEGCTDFDGLFLPWLQLSTTGTVTLSC